MGQVRIEIDALVRGHVGTTPRVTEARVYRLSPWGWVAGVDDQSRQVIIHDPEVVGPPRPEKDRRDIPERLR